MVADLADLHLGDKFIDLLKTRKLTRPCSIDLPHRDFVKLQADLEIYVNGIATGRIRNLNAWIDTARVKSWRVVGRESMMEPLLC